MNTDNSRNAAAIVLIGLGVLFLAGDLLNLSLDFGAIWPFLIILPGVYMLAQANVQPQKAISGAVMVTLGGIFLYQMMTNRWESWAYVWALLIAANGVGILLARRNGYEGRTEAEARRITSWGIGMFVVGFIFFEGIVFGGFGRFWPVLLIGTGLFLLYRSRQPKPKREMWDT